MEEVLGQRVCLTSLRVPWYDSFDLQHLQLLYVLVAGHDRMTGFLKSSCS